MLRFLLPAFLFLVGQASAQAESATTGEPARVLVYTVSAGFQHGVVKRRPAPDGSGEALSLVEQLMSDWAAEDERFEVVVTRDAKAFTKENLATFDVVFFYTTGELPLTEEQRKAFFAFVREGGGFAGAHCATRHLLQGAGVRPHGRRVLRRPSLAPGGSDSRRGRGPMPRRSTWARAS